MADRFVQDLAALDERSRRQLRSLAATRAHVLSTPPETAKMRFFKNRPLLAMLLVLALVGAASGGAYAVHHAFLTIDTSKSLPEIEHDVKSQLAQNGVPAEVNADHTADGDLQIRINSNDLSLLQKLRDMGVVVNSGGTTHSAKRQIAVRRDCELDDEQTRRLTTALSSHEVVTAVATNSPETMATIERVLAAAGFTDVELEDADGDIVVRVKSPAAP